ncbi:MAG: YbfB/YjiJ family MFS transporter [Rhodobiaceae bacterium]|nr:YbfB/YjiJ family MFS transporter [Rhodobiaceae bacterium]
MGIGRFVYTPILPFMADAVPLNESQAGFIASANYLGYLLGALAGALGKLPGTKRMWFISGLLLSAAVTALMALTHSVAIFAALRLVGGIASAFVLVFSASLVFDRLTLQGRQGLTPVLFAGVGFGIAASAVLVALLARSGADWRTMWQWSAALTLVATAFAAVLIPAAPDAGPSATGDSRKPDGRLTRLTLGYGLFGFGYVITATFINTIVRAEPDLQFLEDVIWLIVGLAGVPSVAFWAMVAKRTGPARGVALACLAEALGVGLSVASTHPAAMILAAILLGGTFMGITAIGLGHARALSRADPRRVVALMTAAFGVGQVAGPVFAGYAHRIGDSFLVPSLAAAAALVVAAVLIESSR